MHARGSGVAHARGHLRVSRFARRTTEKREERLLVVYQESWKKILLRKRAVLTSKADYNGMATSNQGFFFPIISTFVFLNCEEQKSLGFQTKAYVHESYCDLSKRTHKP